MNIVFDMDNTLTDGLGAAIRPGIITLLERLKADGHILMLWTNSTKDRARYILHSHDLTKYLSNFVFRENYDPDSDGTPKDNKNELRELYKLTRKGRSRR